jgi:DNA-binding PadR family transcriptional regulator
MAVSKNQPQPLHDLTAFQRDLLVVVDSIDESEVSKGLRLKGVLEDYYGEPINHGRLYPNLDDLMEKGLLSKSDVDGRTNEYRLTSRGLRELDLHRSWVGSQ